MNANVMARRKDVKNTLCTGGNHDRRGLSEGRRGMASVDNKEEPRACEDTPRERDVAGGEKVV